MLNMQMTGLSGQGKKIATLHPQTAAASGLLGLSQYGAPSESFDIAPQDETPVMSESMDTSDEPLAHRGMIPVQGLDVQKPVAPSLGSRLKRSLGQNAAPAPKVADPAPDYDPNSGESTTPAASGLEGSLKNWQNSVAAKPERPKPGILRQVLGGLAGAGVGIASHQLGYKVGDSIIHGDYNRQMQDYNENVANAKENVNLNLKAADQTTKKEKVAAYEKVNHGRFDAKTEIAHMIKQRNAAALAGDTESADYYDEKINAYQENLLDKKAQSTREAHETEISEDVAEDLEAQGLPVRYDAATGKMYGNVTLMKTNMQGQNALARTKEARAIALMKQAVGKDPQTGEDILTDQEAAKKYNEMSETSRQMLQTQSSLKNKLIEAQTTNATAHANLANRSPGTGSHTPAFGASIPNAPPLPAIDPAKESILAKYPQDVRDLAKDFLSYHAILPSSGRAAMDPKIQLALRAAGEADPDFFPDTYQSRQRLLTSMTSGRQGKEVNAINTVIGHMAELKDAGEALAQNDLRVLNMLASKWGLETGNSAPAVYDAIVNRVAPETVQAYLGTGGEAGDRAKVAHDFNIANSPQARNAVIQTAAQLLTSKINTTQRQWQGMMGARPFPLPGGTVLTPEAQEGMKRILGRPVMPLSLPGKAVPSAGATGKVKVRNKLTGETGTVSQRFLDTSPGKFEVIQ